VFHIFVAVVSNKVRAGAANAGSDPLAPAVILPVAVPGAAPQIPPPETPPSTAAGRQERRRWAMLIFCWGRWYTAPEMPGDGLRAMVVTGYDGGHGVEAWRVVALDRISPPALQTPRPPAGPARRTQTFAQIIFPTSYQPAGALAAGGEASAP